MELTVEWLRFPQGLSLAFPDSARGLSLSNGLCTIASLKILIVLANCQLFFKITNYELRITEFLEFEFALIH